MGYIMETVLHSLYDLCEIELEIVKVFRDQQELPAQIKTLESKIQGPQSKLTSLKTELQETQSALDTLKKDIEEENSALQTSNDRLNTVKSNKEYDAVNAEIATHKLKIEGFEDKSLALMDKVEDLEQQIPDAEKLLEEQTSKYSPEINKLKEHLDSAQAKIEILKEKTNSLKEQIPKQPLGAFERLLKSRYKALVNGKQKSIIARLKPGVTSCEVCGSEVNKPLQQKVRRSEMVSCDACNALLIWKEN